MLSVGSKIKSLRENQGKSLRSLATECGLSPGLISQVESGQTSPSLSTLLKIADALHCPIGSFFDNPLDEEALVKRDKRRKLLFADRDVTYELVTPSFLDGKIRVLTISLAPGQFSSLERISHRDQEVLFVQEGEVTIEFDNQKFLLHEGDSLTFDANKPHRYGNLSSAEAKILLVVYS